jgi:hypothetical protein
LLVPTKPAAEDFDVPSAIQSVIVAEMLSGHL